MGQEGPCFAGWGQWGVIAEVPCPSELSWLKCFQPRATLPASQPPLCSLKAYFPYSFPRNLFIHPHSFLYFVPSHKSFAFFHLVHCVSPRGQRQYNMMLALPFLWLPLCLLLLYLNKLAFPLICRPLSLWETLDFFFSSKFAKQESLYPTQVLTVCKFLQILVYSRVWEFGSTVWGFRPLRIASFPPKKRTKHCWWALHVLTFAVLYCFT